MNASQQLKSLPIGVQTFENIVTSNAVFIDKTEILYTLLKEDIAKRYFLSRPRRFGKSITCSTLAAIFEGRKELFKDLWLGKSNYHWTKHPVLYFDFSQISHQTPEILVRGLHSALEAHARKYSLTLKEEGLKEKFAELIKTLGEKLGPIVIIVDEYDKPIVDHIDDLALADRARAALKDFYGTLKGVDVDANMHFLFITGVSKFSKVALFSDLNNLADLTLDNRAAALVGYTDEEVDHYLHKHIKAFADERKESFQQTRETLRRWYNGYRFTEAPVKVYNPFSLHNCLTQKSLRAYWFVSGTPTFLMKWIEHNPRVADQIDTVEGEKVSSIEMDTFSLERYGKNFKVLLLQTGYLTLTGYDPASENFSVAYPNYEVRRAMTEQVMMFVGLIQSVQFGDFVAKFTKAFDASDIGLFCQHLQDFFTLIPHTIIVNREKFYQGTFYMICRLLGGTPLAEVATHLGFIDIMLENNKYRYIIETKKRGSPEAALRQIGEKGYAKASKLESKKPIILVGILFKKTKTGVKVTWKTKSVR